MIGTRAKKKGNWEKKRERKQQNKGNLIKLKYRGSSSVKESIHRLMDA